MQSLLLLKECINAETSYRLLVNEYIQEREILIAGHYPAYETKYGTIQQKTISVENVVIHIIEAEQRIKEQLKLLKSRRKLLQQALSVLDSKELEIFYHVVFGDQTSIDKQEIQQLEQPITQKLVNYLENHSLKGA